MKDLLEKSRDNLLQAVNHAIMTELSTEPQYARRSATAIVDIVTALEYVEKRLAALEVKKPVAKKATKKEV